MLTKLIIRNFKRFAEAEIELGQHVVLIGPNNSGKTTALQALALWDVGLHAWLAKRGDRASPQKRPGVTINRRDLISIPVPSANLLWRALHVRNVQRVQGENEEKKSKTTTANVRIDVIVEGVTDDHSWSCGLEFDYSNEESFACRPVRLPGHEQFKVSSARFSDVPIEASKVEVTYLPPMSGLADREFIKQTGEIGFLIGQGRTAEVLRNLCYQVYAQPDKTAWEDIVRRMKDLFGVTLHPPQYIQERSEILMDYEERDLKRDVSLDLANAGRGLHQTLLLLAHLYTPPTQPNQPARVLLLDEPDAHLEILRQRQIFRLLTEVAEKQRAQIIAASHSEVVLNEAAGRGKVVAFVGRPHTINDRGGQVVKSLTDIGWDLYYQAEVTGWLLALEGPTDLAILQAFARSLEHPAAEVLQQAFVHYVATNRPTKARDLFWGLREAKPDLLGIAIFDRIDAPLQPKGPLVELMWSRRELENYFCRPDVLRTFARGERTYDLFAAAEAERRVRAMEESIREVTLALSTLGHPDPWSADTKATDDFLDPVFRVFFQRLGLPLTFRKADYHQLATYVPRTEIDPEIIEKLDAIVDVARRAAAGK